jgi:macrolide transport system ATP-binding/permease protein
MRLLAELRYAFRTILHNPGFALIAILSVALGVGLNAAMFSYTDAILLRPLPVPGASSVVRVVSTALGTRVGSMSYPDYADLRDQSRAFSALTAYEMPPMGVTPSRETVAQMVLGMVVSGNFFSGLGVDVPIGRSFRPDEDAIPGRDLVAIISHSLWERMYASDPNVAGRKLRVNGAEFTVIGVASEDFTGPEAFVLPDVFVPLHSFPQAIPNSGADFLTGRSRREFKLLGRLKPGVSEAQAQAEISLAASHLAAQYPDTNRGRGVTVMNFQKAKYEDDPADAVAAFMLLGITSLVLLIACANVANLVLGRGAARAKEIAIRLAIGGSRWQLVRQMLIESLVLAAAGGAGGLAIAYAAVRFFASIRMPADFELSFGVRMDTRLLLFSMAVSIATGLIFGLLPALRATSSDLASTIKASDQGPARAFLGGRLAPRNLLVIAQLTFSVVLLIVSAVFVRGFAAARALDPGFRVDHTLYFSLDTTMVRYDETKARDFYRKLKDRLRDQPGVADVSMSWTIPFNAGQQALDRIILDGVPHKAGEDYPIAWSNSIDENYLALMGSKIVRGRNFDTRDTKTSPRVVLVNETFAARMWPGRDAIGQRFRVDSETAPELQVVGVVKNSKYLYWAESPQMALWLPLSQDFQSHAIVELRTVGDPAEMAAPARANVRALDADMPIVQMRTMQAFYEDRYLFGPRLLARMVTGIGVIGLVLSVIGLYGVVAYAVSRRTREIGIRMAVGAKPRDVIRMVLEQGLAFTLVGIVIGIAIAIPAGGVLQQFAVGATTHDPTILTGVSAILAAVMIAACWIPARRASRVDPTLTLRQE